MKKIEDEIYQVDSLFYNGLETCFKRAFYKHVEPLRWYGVERRLTEDYEDFAKDNKTQTV